MHVRMKRLLACVGTLVGALAALGVWAPQAECEPIQVTTTGGKHATVSPDGNWIAYASLEGGIVRIPVAGGEPELLCPYGREPDWGRAGNLIVFRNDDQLLTVDAETHEVQLVRQGGSFDDDPAWSPQGDEIAVQGSSTSITIVAYPGGAISTIPCGDPDGSGCEGEGPAWSPDASYLAFEDGVDLLKIARTGGTAELVYHCPWDLSMPAWSPAGRWIAVSMGDSTSYENHHIWIVDARGSAYGISQQTWGAAEDYRPAWSPDGQTICFDSARTGQSEIWKVGLQPPTPVERTTWGQLKREYGR